MKIKTFNMTFVCENGKYALDGCTKFPTLEMFEESAENLSGLGLGELKKIVIDKIRWNEKD